MRSSPTSRMILMTAKGNAVARLSTMSGTTTSDQTGKPTDRRKLIAVVHADMVAVPAQNHTRRSVIRRQRVMRDC